MTSRITCSFTKLHPTLNQRLAFAITPVSDFGVGSKIEAFLLGIGWVFVHALTEARLEFKLIFCRLELRKRSRNDSQLAIESGRCGSFKSAERSSLSLPDR